MTSQKHLAIVITGTVGSGKSTVMAELTDLLEKRHQPSAGIDMDHLRWFYPRPADDPFGGEVGRKHLAYLAESYRALRIPLLVLADVIEDADGRQQLADVLQDFEVHVVRLLVPITLIEQRLRHRENAENLQWYLHRAPELDAIMDAANVGDTVIDVGNRPARDIAIEIAQRLKLLP